MGFSAVILPAGIQVRTVEEGFAQLNRNDINGKTKLDILKIIARLQEENYQRGVAAAKADNAMLSQRIRELSAELDKIAYREERVERVQRPALIALGLLVGAPLIALTGGAALGAVGFFGGLAGGMGASVAVLVNVDLNEKEIDKIGRLMRENNMGFLEAKQHVMQNK